MKPLSEYNRHSQKLDGKRPECRICTKKYMERYIAENPLEHRAKVMASTILKRLKYCHREDYLHLRCYRENNVQCLLGETIAEIVDVLLANFREDIVAIIADGKTPSVDRIDPKGNYELGNIRILDAYENGAMGFRNANEPRKKPVKATYPDGRVEAFESTKEAARRTGVNDICGLIRRNGVSRKDRIKFSYAN